MESKGNKWAGQGEGFQHGKYPPGKRKREEREGEQVSLQNGEEATPMGGNEGQEPEVNNGVRFHFPRILEEGCPGVLSVTLTS